MKKKILFSLLILLNINIVSAKERMVDYITNLYNNSNKQIITNNGIEYNYATSVNLMNDRLGGTTTLDGGNIRYYGAEKTYLDNSTGADGIEEVGNWKALIGSAVPFANSTGCNSYMRNNGVTDEQMQ